MKVLILGNPDAIHTLRWIRALSAKGIEVGVYSITKFSKETYAKLPNIKLYGGSVNDSLLYTSKTLGKISYIKALPGLIRTIKSFKPDILHSHYISSSGILGMLSFFAPHIVSVWGSDIYEFPQINVVYRTLTRLCLKRAQKILSTSKVMAQETNRYTNKNIEVTPFGIDLNKFKKEPVKNLFSENDIVVGTVKAMREKYGIKYLVQAFASVKRQHPELPLKLLLVGGGQQSDEIKVLINKLGIAQDSIMTGYVDHDDVPQYHNMLTIYVSVSVDDSESFGVAIIEAGACEKPVIVSNVGGLPEVVEDGVTGIVVPPRDIEATSNAIEKLALDENLRNKMGKAGRERVKRLYNWEDNVNQMINIYHNILKN